MHSARTPHRASGVLFSASQSAFGSLARLNHGVVRRWLGSEILLAALRRRECQRKSMGHPNGIVREETIDETHLINNEEAKDQTYQS